MLASCGAIRMGRSTYEASAIFRLRYMAYGLPWTEQLLQAWTARLVGVQEVR